MQLFLNFQKLLLKKHFVPASFNDKGLQNLLEEQKKTTFSVSGKEIRDFYVSLFAEEEIASPEQFCPSMSITCPENCDTSSKSHCSSLLHQAAVLSKDSPRLPPLLIPRSNPGYKILSRLGWVDPAETGIPAESSGGTSACTGGLGRQGQGRRLPISTILKRDRFGIGADQKIRSRITHFAPCDVRAVRNSHPARRLDRPLKLDKRYREKLIKAEKRKENRFRRELNIDDEWLKLLYQEHGCPL